MHSPTVSSFSSSSPDSVVILFAIEMANNSEAANRKAKPRPLPFLLLFIFAVFCGFLFAAHLLFASSSSFLLPFSGLFVERQLEEINGNSTVNGGRGPPCRAMANDSICCDRTDYHSDLCFMRGDVRLHPSSSSILLYSANRSADDGQQQQQEEKIQPYTRKWEAALKIVELRLRRSNSSDAASSSKCDVRHDVPALVFSAGGYTGNLFHAFNNGILPLYITSQHLHRRVVLVVVQYRDWWYTKYREILSQLSDFPPIDFLNDTRTHCFPEAIVGLRFHRTLGIDPRRTVGGKTLVDFHHMLDEAYKPHIQSSKVKKSDKPKLVIVCRNGARAIENEEKLVKLGEEIGFDVEILRPVNTMGLAYIYRVLSGCDVMIGVHGAALTHFLFMRPGSVFLQIVPLGMDEVARLCYAEAAMAIGLEYREYKIVPRESSLYRKYKEDDAVLQDPKSVNARGWEAVKEIYLQGQNVSLDMSRLHDPLAQAYQYVVSKKFLNG